MRLLYSAGRSYTQISGRGRALHPVDAAGGCRCGPSQGFGSRLAPAQASRHIGPPTKRPSSRQQAQHTPSPVLFL